MTSPVTSTIPEPTSTRSRSRRALLAGALGAVGTWTAMAIGRPQRALGAAGDYLVIGGPNSAGPAQTSLSTYALGASFTLQTTNDSTGATGIFGWASSAGPNRTRGVYGRSSSPAGYGVEGTNTASHGAGAAVHAAGGENHGLDATAGNLESYAMRGVHTASGVAIRGQGQTGVEGIADVAGGTGVRGRADASGGATGVLGQGGNEGVRGETDLNGGSGVLGIASGISGLSSGVYGACSDSTGYGVRASNTATSGVAYGIYAETSSPTGFAGYFMGRVFTTKFYELIEIADPTPPGADRARIFARDIGGKTQLCVRFPTGVVQVLATEP